MIIKYIMFFESMQLFITEIILFSITELQMTTNLVAEKLYLLYSLPVLYNWKCEPHSSVG